MMISTNDLSDRNRTNINGMIERYGWKIAEEAACWTGNEGLDTEEAICEAAQTTYELGALFTALLADGYIEEEKIFPILEKGLERYLEEN